jgi:thiol-disulfide isomerase/thioredoxin
MWINAVSLSLALSSFAIADPPTDVEVFNCIRRIQARYAEVERTDFRAAKQQFRAIIADGAGGLNIGELTPYQAILIGPLLQSGAPTDDQKLALTESLERASADATYGAAALLMLHKLKIWDDPERTYLTRFFDHPAMATTMNGWFGPSAINSFGLEPAQMLEFGARIEDAILSINPGGFDGTPNRSSVARLFAAFDHPDVTAEFRSRRDRIHIHLLSVARAALSKQAPTNGGSAEPQKSKTAGIIDLVEYLEGPAGQSMLIGYPAPTLEFSWTRGPDGAFRTLDDLRGKVVVLDFWATWCGPCVATFPNLRALQSHYAKDDVVIIGVTSIQGYHVPKGGKPLRLNGDPDREQSLMSEYITDNNITWNISYSMRGVTDPRYDVYGIPHLTIIDRQGRVRHNGLHPGGTPFEEKTRIIDGLLSEPK